VSAATLSEHDACQHRGVVHAGGGHDEAVPDGAAEGEFFPDVEGNADRVEQAADGEQDEAASGTPSTQGPKAAKTSHAHAT
jgi:hypothetical protein